MVDADRHRRDDAPAAGSAAKTSAVTGLSPTSNASASRRDRDDLLGRASRRRRGRRNRPREQAPARRGGRPGSCRRRPPALSWDSGCAHGQPLMHTTRPRTLRASARRCIASRGGVLVRIATPVLPIANRAGSAPAGSERRRRVASLALPALGWTAGVLRRPAHPARALLVRPDSTSSPSRSTGAGRSTTTAASSTSSTSTRSCGASCSRPRATLDLPGHRLPRCALDQPSRAGGSRRSRCVAVMIPFWSSFVVRTYALVNLLGGWRPARPGCSHFLGLVEPLAADPVLAHRQSRSASSTPTCRS